MIIGVPKEIKDKEYRVSLTPGGAESLVHEGHEVLVQHGAGVGSGYGDEEYVRGRRLDYPDRRRGVGARGHDRQGQGAAASGVRR